MSTAIYMLAFGLLVLGMYTVVAKKNVIKIIIGVLIIEYSVNMLLVLVGYRHNGVAPIQTQGQTAQEFARVAVDPLPQAMVRTSIVIGLSLVAMMVVLAIRLHEKYGTFDTDKIRKLRG